MRPSLRILPSNAASRLNGKILRGSSIRLTGSFSPGWYSGDSIASIETI